MRRGHLIELKGRAVEAPTCLDVDELLPSGSDAAAFDRELQDWPRNGPRDVSVRPNRSRDKVLLTGDETGV